MCEKCNIIAVKKDETLFALQSLQEQGYDKVIWASEYNGCMKCQMLNNKEWTLEEFLQDTLYEAPMFSKTHPNCLCKIKIINSQTNEELLMDYTGNYTI